ncbi:hypothetical protein [Saccharopolyspora taberi]|uniref:Uncharacterized protein n=1 Tax=Saccharopolyspora taberi TaxID=60895 RepID=A0ABN3VN18_9PSEU
MYGLLCAAAITLITGLALLPLRGGRGRHAHAGPGTLTVQNLRDQEIEWPRVDWDDYVGRHRLRRHDMFVHRLEWALMEWAESRPESLRTPCGGFPPPAGWSR